MAPDGGTGCIGIASEQGRRHDSAELLWEDGTPAPALVRVGLYV